MIFDTNMRSFIRVVKGLSQPNRVNIPKMLQGQPMCPSELGNAHLASPTKEATWVTYHLSDGSNSPYVAHHLGNLRHWLQDDKGIKELQAKCRLLDAR